MLEESTRSIFKTIYNKIFYPINESLQPEIPLIYIWPAGESLEIYRAVKFYSDNEITKPTSSNRQTES